MREGGFDVVIGNPPYLEVREVEYSLGGFASRESNAIHAMCIERSCDLLSKHGAISMIVPLALPSTQRMRVVQQIIERNRSTWFSNFAWRPAKLFDTVNRALTIFVGLASSTPNSFSTRYIKWSSADRNALFERLLYSGVDRERPSFWVPKMGSSIEQHILRKLLSADSKARTFFGRSQGRVYYRTTGGLYWKVFTNFAPAFSVNGIPGSSSRETSFTTREVDDAVPLVAVLSSNCFWWWYTITSNLRDLNPTDIQEFPVPRAALSSPTLNSLASEYIEDLQRNSTMLARNQKSTGRTETQSFKIRTSKPLIDRIDMELGKLLGLSQDETDFIINYDIKYRMGASDDEE
jgi:hypothetical protein